MRIWEENIEPGLSARKPTRFEFESFCENFLARESFPHRAASVALFFWYEFILFKDKPMRLFDFAFCSLLLLLCVNYPSVAAEPWRYDATRKFSVELRADSPTGEASIREHSIVWHPVKKKYYLLADVVPLKSPYHPNTYETEIHLWSSLDLTEWRYHGVAVKKGAQKNAYDAHGVASPAGAIFMNGKIYVPFSARRTRQFTRRNIGLAWSGDDPEQVPWTKSKSPISDLEGEDDDPALMIRPGDSQLCLYHRRTGPGGYRVVWTSSETPEISESWPTAKPVTSRPESVRAQELTGAFHAGKQCHLLIIEHLRKGGIKIAHLISKKTNGPFLPVAGQSRYLPAGSQPSKLAYSGHISPVVQNEKLISLFWTVPQHKKRYGLLGHPVLQRRDLKP